MADTEQRLNVKYSDLPLGDPRRRIFFEQYLTQAARQFAVLEIEKRKFTQILDDAKKAGIPKGDIKHAIDRGREEDLKAASEKTKRLLEIDSWFDTVPSGVTLSFLSDDGVAVGKAYHDGKIDAAMARDKNNPHAKGTADHEDYERGYDEQKRINFEKFRKELDANFQKAQNGKGEQPAADTKPAKPPSAAVRRAEEAAAERDRVEANKAKTSAAQSASGEDTLPGASAAKAGEQHIEEMKQRAAQSGKPSDPLATPPSNGPH